MKSMAVTDSQSFILGEERFVHDAYSALDYKRVLATQNSSGRDWMAPTWMGEHRRRIQAYIALLSYRDNSSRLLLTALTSEQRDAKDQRREYGDANLITEQIRSSLMGNQQTISVEGAEDYDPSKPVATGVINDRVNGEEPGTAKAAFELQQFLRQWAEDERFTTKIIETERNAVSMGDGVYSLGFDVESGRVALRTWDPGCYFPVLTDGDENAYPDKVHLAWELPNEDKWDSKIRVRRITYELREVQTPYSVPWSDTPVTKNCFFTDAIYVLDQNTRSPEDLTDSTATYTEDSEGEINNRPLGIDFVPVIHIPNTVAIADHFGQASITKILQILDDLQATDSDLQSASALTGSPMVAISGQGIQGRKFELGPNRALNLGEGGEASMLSGAEGLEGLSKYRDGLLSRAAINARLPESALGRVKAEDFSSGVHLQLSFGPLTSLIDEMRLVRKDKYRLILKFVQRFYMKQGVLSGPVLTADLLFGSYLPSDQAGVVKLVVELRSAKPPLISRQTAMRMLQEVGIPIDDPVLEEMNIDRTDFESAIQLIDATGNAAAVQERLGVPVGGTPQASIANE